MFSLILLKNVIFLFKTIFLYYNLIKIILLYIFIYYYLKLIIKSEF